MRPTAITDAEPSNRDHGARSRVDDIAASIMRSVRGRRSPRTRLLLLVAAGAIFAGALVLSVRNLPPVDADRNGLYLVAAAFVAAAGTLVNGGEYALSARLLGSRIGVLEATRVAVLASAANVLPIPGSALVRIQSLKKAGHGYGSATTVTAAVGLSWVGVAAFVAGVLLAPTADDTLAFGLLAAGIMALGFGALSLKHRDVQVGFPSAVTAVVVLELVSVGFTALRLYLVMRALGYDATFADAAVLAAAAIAAVAAGVFPGGLGLREVLSGAAGAAVGLGAAVGTLAAALDRVINLAMLAVITGIMLLFNRRSYVQPPTDEQAEVA